MGLAPGARLCVALLLVLVVAGCAVSPPEWAYFDTDRHPVGAVPAHAGFYTGAYVIAPPLYVLFLPVTLLFTIVTAPVALMGRSGQESWDKDVEQRGPTRVSERMGIGFGVILGAPFHLVALPFGTREKDATMSGEDGTVYEGSPRYDDAPPAVPRDYPWPPKPAR